MQSRTLKNATQRIKWYDHLKGF